MNQMFSNAVSRYLSFFVMTLGGFITHQLFAQCNTPNTLTVPGMYTTPALSGNGNFNAIVFGNQTATSGDTEGRLAVGGNFSVNTGYSVGQATIGQNAPAGTDNFIVNGTFTNSSGIGWGVRGNFVYVTNAPGSTLPTHVSGEGTNIQAVANSRLNFAPLKNYYINLSAGLSAQTPLGTSSVSAQNEINLVGDGTAHNYVFNVTLPNGILSGVNFTNIPAAGSTILINILNTTVSITGGAISNTSYRTQTLFNFLNATTISMASFLLEGSVLAPNANFTASGGGINGQSVIGGNVSQQQGFEFHNFCLNQNNPLPVTLSSFLVAKEEQAVRLTWTTVNEQNNRGFAIEQSLDAKSWKQLTFVQGVGTSTETHTYTYRHEQPGPGVNYYRLGQIDYDGQTTYSAIRTVTLPDEVVVVYPNPVAEKVYLTLPQSGQYPYQISLFNSLGKTVMTMAKQNYSSGVELNVQNLTEGEYILQLVREGQVTVKKLVIKH